MVTKKRIDKKKVSKGILENKNSRSKSKGNKKNKIEKLKKLAKNKKTIKKKISKKN